MSAPLERTLHDVARTLEGRTADLRAPADNRFLPILAALILGGFSCLSLLSYLRARDLMDRQITSTSLPLTSDAVVFRLEQILLKPMLASGLMGGNNFIEDNLLAGETNPSQIQDYLARIQQKTGAITTFLVSDRSYRYYHSSGVLKRVSDRDPQDRWYFRFRASGPPIEINIDRDTADLKRITAFINVPIRSRDGRFLGATGLGLDFNALQNQLQHYQRRYGARILLMNQEGQIMLASDQSKGSLHQIKGLAPLAPRILGTASSTEVLSKQGGQLYVRSNRIPEIGWTLVVIQQRTAEQSAFIDLLAQNLTAAVLISLILVGLAQLTLGREQRRLETLARTDMLSGLLNRSVFETLFQRLASQARANQTPLAVALMDIDDFKAINDRHGHPVGDAVIQHVSRRIQARVGEPQPLFRWGGEEFLLLLPGCDLPAAVATLEGIRRDLANHAYRAQPAASASAAADDLPEAIPVTLSAGVSLVLPGESSSEVVQRSDKALYAAKQSGRNRVCALEATLCSHRHLLSADQHRGGP